MWKEYCLRHCFRVPEGFRLPEEVVHSFLKESAGESVRIQCLPSDPSLYVELESLRERVAKAVKESAELTRKLQALEILSAREDHFSVLVDELNEETSVDGLSHELEKVESELIDNFGKLTSSWMEAVEHKLAKRARDWEMDLSTVKHTKGLFQRKLEEIESLLTDMKSM